MSQTDLLLEFREVYFNYTRTVPVVRNLSFKLARGELVWLIGGNGSGKSTTLKLASGMLRPRSGTIDRHGRATLVPPSTVFHELLTVGEELAYLSSLCKSQDVSLDVAGAAAAWGFDEYLMETPICDLSSGWRQRLALALANGTGSELIMLDEPFANVDSEGVALVAEWVKSAISAGGAAVIVHHGAPPCLQDAPATTIELGRTRNAQSR